MHDACMVRYVDLVVRQLGNPKQRAKSLGNHLGERLGKLFGRDRGQKSTTECSRDCFCHTGPPNE